MWSGAGLRWSGVGCLWVGGVAGSWWELNLPPFPSCVGWHGARADGEGGLGTGPQNPMLWVVWCGVPQGGLA